MSSWDKPVNWLLGQHTWKARSKFLPEFDVENKILSSWNCAFPFIRRRELALSSMIIFLTWCPEIPSKCFILASWYNDLFLPNLFLISLKIFFSFKYCTVLFFCYEPESSPQIFSGRYLGNMVSTRWMTWRPRTYKKREEKNGQNQECTEKT